MKLSALLFVLATSLLAAEGTDTLPSSSLRGNADDQSVSRPLRALADGPSQAGEVPPGGITVIPTSAPPEFSRSCPIPFRGYDSPGNDLKAISNVAEAADCCSHCGKTSRCEGYTWTNFNGGTCWLKSAMTIKTQLPGAVSAMYEKASTKPGNCGWPVQGVDYIGNDLMHVKGDRSACCQECWKTEGCKGYTWTDYEGGTCWLKSKLDKVKFNQNAYSAGVLNRFEGYNPVEEDIDYFGNDFTSFPAADDSKCPQFCWRFPSSSCSGWTWTNFNGGTCWLKSKLAGRTHVKGAKSGWQRENSGSGANEPPSPIRWPSCTGLEENVDFFGNDLLSVAASTFDKCCTECDWTPGCQGWTWTNFNGGTCWLKSNVNASSKKTLNGAVSGLRAVALPK